MVTDIEVNIRIYKQPSGRGTGPKTLYRLVAPVYARFWTGLCQQPSLYRGIVKVTWRVFNQLNACFCKLYYTAYVNFLIRGVHLLTVTVLLIAL
jgi:hypothetical protein